jgi:type VI secretion system protein ImpF
VSVFLRERLQPSLIDRLIDEERILTIYELGFDREALRRFGIAERDIVAAITALGLSPAATDGSAVMQGDAAEALRLRFSAPHGQVGLSKLKALVLEPPGAPEGVALESFCSFETRNVLNDAAESLEQRSAVARRLREHVGRDLSILLNASCLESTVDLSAVPHVKRSVLNYGMPSPTGKSVSSVSLTKTARIIEDVIRQFEPRLTRVRVAPEAGRESRDPHEISFRIDAELWNQPAPHQVVLRTRIDVESGEVRVNDAGGR